MKAQRKPSRRKPSPRALQARVRALRKENHRLSNLVYGVERIQQSHNGSAECPFCHARFDDGVLRHRIDCEAFTPEGVLR